MSLWACVYTPQIHDTLDNLRIKGVNKVFCQESRCWEKVSH